MYNAILDRLPEDYNGWLIRTDYRIGVQIQLCMSDLELTDSEKTGTVLRLFYGNGIPDFQTALDGLFWFMSCGNPVKGDADNEPEIYSFEYDSARIVSAFKRVYGRDISREQMHWFEFIPMLGDLEGTAFSAVLDIRQTSAADIDVKKRAEFSRLKKRFSLPNQYTEEEEETIANVLERVRGGGREV